MKIINLAYSTLICLFVYLFICLFPPSASSSTSSDENWTIEVDEVNISSDIPTISNPKKQLEDEGESSEISSARLNSKGPFSFSISNSIIDYGILSATNPIYRTTNVAVSNAKNKFIVTTYEDHPLSFKGSNTIIPDSTCDNGSCSQITTALWENTLTYGFGYRCDNVIGNNCPVEFSNGDYYKQFSNSLKNESPQIIMSNNSGEKINETQIIYKVNISKTQPAGSYTNTITYIASPGY